MAISDVLRVFRDLKREGVVNDYVVFGSVAAMAYTRPFFTRDIDIALAVQSDVEFLEVFRRVSDFGSVEGHSVVIEGTPVEMFPVNISPVIEDALAESNVLVALPHGAGLSFYGVRRGAWPRAHRCHLGPLVRRLSRE